MLIRKPVTDKRTLHVLDICEVECQLTPVIDIDNFFIDSPLKVQVRRSFNKSYYFYVFDKDRCVALVEFENNNASKNILKLTKYKNVFIPHATVHPDYRGLSISSNIYLYFLLNASNVVLMSYKHTKAAVALWDSISRKINKVIIYHNLVTGENDKRQSKTNIKLLTC